MSDLNPAQKVQLDLIEKQVEFLQQMMKPTMMVTEKTLRDEIAMSALAGLVLANWGRVDADRADLASWAYAIADAMMEARK
jgi:hypothetical protein